MTDRSKLLEFVQMIARMNLSGDVLRPSNEDDTYALDNLILRARYLAQAEALS